MKRRSRNESSIRARRSPRLAGQPSSAALVDAGVLFARNLRQVCASRNLTPAQLAARIGTSQRTVERMLSGRANPVLSIIEHIARKLHVAVTELLREI